MSTNYYALMLNVTGPVPVEQIKGALAQAKSWAMFHPSAWVIASNLSAQEWYDRLKPLMKPTDHFWIIKADMSHHKGWVSNVMVEWSKRDHGSQPGL